MAKPKRANDLNLCPCWKVRIYFRGAGMLHVLSKSVPVCFYTDGKLSDVGMVVIDDTEHGDSIGYIDWSAVAAVTWRYAPLASETEE